MRDRHGNQVQVGDQVVFAKTFSELMEGVVRDIDINDIAWIMVAGDSVPWGRWGDCIAKKI